MNRNGGGKGDILINDASNHTATLRILYSNVGPINMITIRKCKKSKELLLSKNGATPSF